MDCRLIAFDLDGTFLDSAKNIPQRNIDALCAAARRGVYAVPATGRILDGIPPAIRALPFIRYYICINGASVVDTQEERVIHSAEIPVEDALRFYTYMDTQPVLYDCYQDGFGWMTERMLARAAEYMPDRGILELIRRLRHPVPELKDYLREKGKGVQKLQAYFKTNAERDRQLAVLPGIFPELLFSTSVSNNIEVNSAAAGKANGLRALCRHLGLDMAQVLALGDGTNDTEMLRAAGRGVAMENAHPDVKAAADALTGTNDEAGVAKAIETLVLHA